jgi:hypothetical protein
VFVRDAEGTWNQQEKLFDYTSGSEDGFGQSVSVSGDTAVVGAFLDDDGGTNRGTIIVFVRDAQGVWIRQISHQAFDHDFSDRGALSANDYFGSSVSVSGDTMVIGAKGVEENGINSGSAYILVRNAQGLWVKHSILIANDGAAEDYFGASVSVSNDRVLVGAWGDGDNGDEAGSAYIFDDRDKDGVINNNDNCIDLYNPGQQNYDGDSLGNVCDEDDDNDGLTDNYEDLNLDGIVDIGETDPLNNDTDSDGLLDGVDPFPLDTDNDGINNNTDLDDDDDGFSDLEEIAAGTNPLDAADYPVIADGDINLDGVVGVIDVLFAQQVLAGTRTLTTEELQYADVAPLVNGVPAPDGQFTVGDLVVIQRKAIGDINF